jgi:hypothetical protein
MVGVIGTRTNGMSSYTYTWCGTQMTVGERYWGRKLRCTECGEEFTARLPVSAGGRSEPEAETKPGDVEPADPELRSRRRRTILLGTAGVAVLALLLWWLGGNREEGFGSWLFRSDKTRTEIGELRFEEAPTVPVALDRDSVAELARIAKAGEGPSALPAFESPAFLQVSAGTRVRVIETYRGGQARVRILSGPQNSRIVWVPIAWVR